MYKSRILIGLISMIASMSADAGFKIAGQKLTMGHQISSRMLEQLSYIMPDDVKSPGDKAYNNFVQRYNRSLFQKTADSKLSKSCIETLDGGRTSTFHEFTIEPDGRRSEISFKLGATETKPKDIKIQLIKDPKNPRYIVERDFNLPDNKYAYWEDTYQIAKFDHGMTSLKVHSGSVRGTPKYITQASVRDGDFSLYVSAKDHSGQGRLLVALKDHNIKGTIVDFDISGIDDAMIKKTPVTVKLLVANGDGVQEQTFEVNLSEKLETGKSRRVGQNHAVGESVLKELIATENIYPIHDSNVGNAGGMRVGR